MTRSQRKPDVFSIGQRIVIQNNVSKLWNIKGIIVSRREHQGHLSNSYVIKVCRTGRQVCRSERHIRALPTNTDTNGINIGRDQNANSIFVSSTGKPRSSIRSPSTVSGKQDSIRGRHVAALSRAAPPTGSQNPAPTSQPIGDTVSGKTVSFNQVIQVFDEEGQDYFDKETLRDLRKPIGSTFKHEVHAPETKGLVQQALSSGNPQTKVDEGDEGIRQIGGGRGRIVTRGGRCIRPSEPCKVAPKHGK